MFFKKFRNVVKSMEMMFKHVLVCFWHVLRPDWPFLCAIRPRGVPLAPHPTVHPGSVRPGIRGMAGPEVEKVKNL